MNQPSKAAVEAAKSLPLRTLDLIERRFTEGDSELCRYNINNLRQQLAAIDTAQQENVAKIEEVKGRLQSAIETINDSNRFQDEVKTILGVECLSSVNREETLDILRATKAQKVNGYAALSTANQRLAECEAELNEVIAAMGQDRAKLKSDTALTLVKGYVRTVEYLRNQLAECEAVMVKKDEALDKINAVYLEKNIHPGQYRESGIEKGCIACISHYAIALQPSTSALAEYVKGSFGKLRDILTERSKGEVETWGFVAAFMQMIDEAEKAALAHYPETKEVK